MSELNQRFLDRVEEIVYEQGMSFSYVPNSELELYFSDLSEDNLEEYANEVAGLASWYN